MELPAVKTMLVRPGYLCVPVEPARLCTVAASGVAVTIFDRSRKFGGIGHYTHPLRTGGHSTTVFAAPALAALVGIFRQAGSDPGDLEVYMYGGAENPSVPGFDSMRGDSNIRVGLDLFGKLGLSLSGSDIGGRFARKLVFYTGTGETAVAKVERVRAGDWYPAAPGGRDP